MRDPARIEPVLDAIRRVWEQSPDLRLGQLLVNAVNPPEPCPELFYIEDEKLVRKVEEFSRRWESETSS